jgi:hypothetical protein
MEQVFRDAYRILLREDGTFDRSKIARLANRLAKARGLSWGWKEAWLRAKAQRLAYEGEMTWTWGTSKFPTAQGAFGIYEIGEIEGQFGVRFSVPSEPPLETYLGPWPTVEQAMDGAAKHNML